MKKNTPILFKKLPSGADIKTDATFVQDLGLLNGVPICKIHYHGEDWIVKFSEIKTTLEVI